MQGPDQCPVIKLNRVQWSHRSQIISPSKWPAAGILGPDLVLYVERKVAWISRAGLTQHFDAPLSRTSSRSVNFARTYQRPPPRAWMTSALDTWNSLRDNDSFCSTILDSSHEKRTRLVLGDSKKLRIVTRESWLLWKELIPQQESILLPRIHWKESLHNAWELESTQPHMWSGVSD